MSSREKRRKRKREPSQTPRVRSKPTREWSSPIPSLPYDMVLMCIARVSRLYYPTLSLVSKSFRSVISSPELYKMRSVLGVTESCLYVCLQIYGDKAAWFTLCRKPKETTGSSGYALARVPISKSPPSRFSSVVAVGSNIYNIVESPSLTSFSRVSILDCKSHTWIEAPSLQVELSTLSASVLDHKIYVAGRDSSLNNSFQVLDTETLIWVSSSERIEERFKEKTFSLDGKFHVVTNKGVVAYDSKQGTWDMVGDRMGWYMFSSAYCVIGNVLYSVSDEVFKWYDTELRLWSCLQGLVGLPKITPDTGIRLADYGGKMMVFWDQSSFPCLYKEIWCVQIALERRRNSSEIEIWGKVEWFDRLLNINSFYEVEKVLSTTL